MGQLHHGLHQQDQVPAKLTVGNVARVTSTTLTTSTFTSAAAATAATTITNSATGTPLLATMFSASTTAGQYTNQTFGVNATAGNFIDQRFNYTASASTSNNCEFRITANSRFAITFNDLAPFTFTNPSGPVAIGAGGFTSAGNSSVTGTVVGTPALTVTNSATGSPLIQDQLATNTTVATGFTYKRFGVNTTAGNFLQTQLDYIASGGANSTSMFMVTGGTSKFTIANNTTAPFTFTNPSGPVAIGAGGFTSAGNSSVTGTFTASGNITTSGGIVSIPTYSSTARCLVVGSGGSIAGQISIAATTAGQARYHLSNNGGVCEWAMGQLDGVTHDFRISSVVSSVGTARFSISSSGVVSIPNLTTSSLVRTNGASELISIPAGVDGQGTCSKMTLSSYPCFKHSYMDNSNRLWYRIFRISHCTR